jgi:hypothetical protein
MSLARTPLEPAKLTPSVQKALAGGPSKMMAARGVMPMPTPGELVTVLYQLALDADSTVASAARGTATELPEKVLIGAVGDAKVDGRVLDWLAPRTIGQPALMNALLNNPSLADPTVATLAGKVGEREVEQIATNEQRLLRHPEIISAMYTNPRARMSTVDRAVELAVRNKVRVPDLAAWDEIAKALDDPGKKPADDQRFAQVASFFQGDDSPLTTGDAEAIDPETASNAEVERATDEAQKKVPIGDMSVSEKIRTATLGNGFARAILVRDPMRIVAVAAIKSPGVTELEAARYAANSSLHEDVVREIARRKEWTRLYSIKLSLSMNPKTPITEASRFMQHLRDKDLNRIVKSKSVPSAVVAQARRLLAQRNPAGSKK